MSSRLCRHFRQITSVKSASCLIIGKKITSDLEMDFAACKDDPEIVPPRLLTSNLPRCSINRVYSLYNLHFKVVDVPTLGKLEWCSVFVYIIL